MNVIHRQHHISTEGVTTSETEEVRSTGFSRALAVLRIAFGFTFLWAFLDKTFALGFSTGAQYAEDGSRAGIDFMAQDAAWLNGGSPTEGFLSFGVPVDNPFHGFFTSLAGQAWVDWLFMFGLLGIGVTLLLGVGMRIGTAAGALMYAFMYAAVAPAGEQPDRRRPPHRRDRDGRPRPRRGRHHVGAGSLVEPHEPGTEVPRPAMTPVPHRTRRLPRRRVLRRAERTSA